MLRTHSLWLCLSLICAAYAAPVHASDNGAPAEERSWYGWQTLTVDGTALAVSALANGIAPGGAAPVNLAGLGVYILGAPIVHALHGNGTAAAGSLGLRVLPIGMAWLTVATCDWSLGGSGGCNDGLGMLTIVAFVLPLVLDPALFAYEPKRDRRTAYVEPWLDVTGAGLTLHRSF